MRSDPFASPRLAMRAVRIEDAADAHAIFSDAAAMTWWSHPAHDGIAQTREKLAKGIASPDWRFWAITLPADDRLIGTLAAHEKRQGGVFEIGYSLARAQWGHGYAAEAVGALVDRLFAAGARRISADTDPDNAASNRLLERLGFTLEGRLRGEWETHIGVRDSLIWGRLAGDDPARPASDLSDLHRAGAGARRGGLALAGLGCALAIVRGLWLPAMPAVLPVLAIALALGLFLIGTVRRIRWHLTQRRG